MRLSVFIWILFSALYSHAQLISKRLVTEQEYNRIVKVNLLSPAVGTITIHYEKRLNENSSIQLEGFYFTGYFLKQQINTRGTGFTVNYRFYLTKHFPEGWFIQPYARYQRYWPISTRQVSSNRDRNAQVGSIGIVLGYQVVSNRRISMDVFAGPVYNKVFVDDTHAIHRFVPLVNGAWIRAGMTLGFLF